MPSIPAIIGVKLAICVVKCFVYTYEIITWPIYSLFRKSINYMPLSDETPGSEDIRYDPEEKRTLAMSTRQGDPGAPWRAVEAMDQLLMIPAAGCETASEVWLRSCRLYANKDAFGTRELISQEYEPGPAGKQFMKVVLGKFFWETFAQAELRVSKLSAALDSMLSNSRSSKAPIAIFSETRAEWLYASQAIFRLGRPLVTLYATLGDDALVHGLNETQVEALFVSDELLGKIPNVVKKCPSIRLVIYFSNGVFYYSTNNKLMSDSRMLPSSQALLKKVKESLPKDFKLMDMVEMEEQGKMLMAADQLMPGDDANHGGFWMPKEASISPQPEDLAVIMYTSGSTGVPKGVELTHRCMTSAIAGFVRRLPVIRASSDIYIGYLPLAHVFEMACEMTCLFNGARIGYGNPQTLTDNSTRIKVGACKGDVTLLRPTMMATVPTVLQRVEKAVWEKITDDGLLAKRLFKFAFDYKLRRMRSGYPSFLVDRLVFRKVRKILGGRIRYIMSGGAPISESSQMFAHVCFAPVIQGYGLTETCSSGCIMETGDMRVAQVGAPVPSVEIILRPWEEGRYSPQDLPNPRGEVLIGGAPISRGYYKQPELTAKDFFTDKNGRRFFCTGDIGQFNADGTLSIIDRKKDLVKLQAGEYVSLAKVELALVQSVFVESVCVYASPMHSYTVTIVSPKKKQLRDLALRSSAMPTEQEIEKLCQEQNLTDDNALHCLLCKDPKVNASVLADLKEMCKSSNLATFEIPQRLHLDPSIWTPESGLVTDALKLKRFNIQAKFQSAIDAMYTAAK